MVSIIIPTCNRRSLLEKAIEVCLCQTWPNIEIIVVDDGSTDDTPEYLAGLQTVRSPRKLTVLRQDNRGPSAARNRGLEIATGEYIKFVDSDDTMDSNAIEQYIGALERHGADLCIGSKRYMGQDGTTAGIAYSPGDVVFERSLSAFFNLDLRPQAILWFFRSSIFKTVRWNEALLAREDTDLLVKVLSYGYTVCGCPTAFYNQRVHSGPRQHSRQFEPGVLESIIGSNYEQLELLSRTGADTRTRRAFASSMSRTALRLWSVDRESAKVCYRIAKKAFMRPELVLLKSYPGYVRAGVYALWLLGGLRLCGPIWQWHLTKKRLRRNFRRIA